MYSKMSSTGRPVDKISEFFSPWPMAAILDFTLLKIPPAFLKEA